MVFSGGYLHAGQYRGVPLRWHWSFPLGLGAFTGFALAPLAWLAVLALVLVHEAGHAALVRRFRLTAVAVDLHALGGETHWVGRPSLRQRVALAWAGVLAQAVAFLVVTALVAAFGPPRALWLTQVVEVYTTANLWMMALNLLPLPGLDGEVAWMILPAWRRRARRRVDARLHPVRTLRRAAPAPSAPDAEARALADVARELQDVVDAHNARALGDAPPRPRRDEPQA